MPKFSNWNCKGKPEGLCSKATGNFANAKFCITDDGRSINAKGKVAAWANQNLEHHVCSWWMTKCFWHASSSMSTTFHVEIHPVWKLGGVGQKLSVATLFLAGMTGLLCSGLKFIEFWNYFVVVI
jgi:hypothetical protein